MIHEADTEYQYARVVEHPDGERTPRAQRGAGDPLALPPRHRADRRLLGRLPGRRRSPPRATPPRRVAMLGFAAGTVARAYERYFPARAIDGVEIDGELFDIGRALLRPAARGRSCASTPRTRGRSCAARRALRRDLPRHLPPALHPVLPVDAGVLRARPRPARARRVDRHQRRPSGGLRRAREGAVGDDGHRLRATSARDPVKATNTILIGSQTRPDARPPAGGGSRACRRRCARSRWRGGAGSRRGLRGGDVYTDDKAPVEWLVDTSIVEYAAGGRADVFLQACLNGTRAPGEHARCR